MDGSYNFDDMPVCKENCVLPLGIPHGDVAGSTKHNEYITYTCSEGFTLVGNRQRKCVGGVYGGSTPSCHLNCDPLYIQNGVVNGDFRHGTNVFVACEENFVYEGSPIIHCMDGSYNFDDMPVCKDVNPCVSSPCLNGATCRVAKDPATDSSKGFECSCKQGYTGEYCGEGEIRNPCSPSPCNHFGRCTTRPGEQSSLEAVCHCTDSYTGDYCDEGEFENPCSPSPCKNGAACDTFPGQLSRYEAVCECTKGYKGEYCDEVVDPCKSQPCLNGGECVMLDLSTYRCKCIEEYLGGNCEIRDPCKPTPCKNGAACTTGPGQLPHLEAVCECTEEYEGEYCDEVVDPCKSQPCLNGGECVMLDFSTYSCGLY
ncbi:uncharacterized protein [Antedon mediterranea]|uniref:uncharacterized protein isoform X2 n=1 Tax=Antedon mediterranea TaxID=105859 RepID=UPI003AF6F973